MIEVWIRHCDEATGRRLCSWPVDELDRLLPTIGRWGVICELGEYGTQDLTGQVRFDDSDAYFEVVVVAEDAR